MYSFLEPANSVLGITETTPDVFVVGVGFMNTSDNSGGNGTWSIRFIDLCSKQWEPRHHRPSAGPQAKVQKMTNISSAIFLNGLTTLPSSPSTVIVADSALGAIYSVDTITGACNIVLDEPALKPLRSAPVLLGVNGIQVSADRKYLYFTNSFQAPLLGRIPIAFNGTAAGPVETIVEKADVILNVGFQADDFALAAHDTAWVTGDPSGYLLKVTPDGNLTRVLGDNNSTLIAGVTAAAFGRGGQSEILYLTTNGGLPYPANGIAGGKVIAVDTT